VPVRSQISPVGSSIDRTVQSANSSIQLLSWPSSNVLHKTQLHPAATLAALCAVLQALLHAVSVYSMPCLCRCAWSKSSLSRGSCLSTCSQCELLEDSEPAYHCSHLWTACHAVSASAAVTCCRALSVCRVEHSKHHHTCLHTHCCLLFDCFGILPMWLQFSQAAHMSLGHSQGNTQLAHVAHYEQHTPCCTQTHTHACMYVMCYCSRFRATQMSQRRLYPSFYVNFTHMPAATPVGCVSVMPCALPSMYISHMAAAAIAEGSCLLRAWSGCSVITGFLQQPEFWCNPRRHCCRCPGTGSTWHKSYLTIAVAGGRGTILHTL
jgi:hypothetical protein